ncbi:MAG: hypothetical protein ACOYON_16340 [Fimbriimonas sp.]
MAAKSATRGVNAWQTCAIFVGLDLILALSHRLPPTMIGTINANHYLRMAFLLIVTATVVWLFAIQGDELLPRASRAIPWQWPTAGFLVSLAMLWLPYSEQPLKFATGDTLLSASYRAVIGTIQDSLFVLSSAAFIALLRRADWKGMEIVRALFLINLGYKVLLFLLVGGFTNEKSYWEQAEWTMAFASGAILFAMVIVRWGPACAFAWAAAVSIGQGLLGPDGLSKSFILTPLASPNPFLNTVAHSVIPILLLSGSAWYLLARDRRGQRLFQSQWIET